LHKWQSNFIVKAIQGVGLDPRHFDLADDDGEIRIKHKWSPSCFTIRSKGASLVALYVVGDGPEWPIGEQSWLTLPPRIDYWLKEVKRDLETPDLWAELQRDDRLLFRATFDDVTENSSFTPSGRAKRDCNATSSTGGGRKAHILALGRAHASPGREARLPR
jgi:hypothetical protein